MYRPLRGKAELDESLVPSGTVHDVRVTTDDGLELHGWHSVANEARAERPLCLFFPGNSGHRGCRARDLELFNRVGCDGLLVDYRGYAENPGKPAEPHIAADAHAIWRFAVEELKVPSNQMIVVGNSLGGGVATRLAMELCEQGTAPAGLVLRATFSSMGDAVASIYPWLKVQRILVERYPSIERVPHITCPLLVMHGTLDRVLPIDQGQRLFDAAPAQSANGINKRFLELTEAGHNNMAHVAADEMATEFSSFLGEIFGEQQLHAGQTSEHSS